MSSVNAPSSMKKVLLILRFVVFALFIICNAVICSAAVWNRCIGMYISASILAVDVYLIFLGALGLAFIFPVILTDLACRNPVTSRVWFECSWVGLFWVMELAGAAALVATAPGQMCSKDVSFTGACVSTSILVAFTWLITISLLMYLVALCTSALCYQKRDPQIWHCAVRYFPWNTARSLSSAPNSPVLPRFDSNVTVVRNPDKTATSGGIAAPKPHRAAPAPLLHTTTPLDRRSSLRPNYRIEMSFPDANVDVGDSMIMERPAPAVPPRHVRETTSSAPSAPATSFYPTYVRNAMAQQPEYVPQRPLAAKSVENLRGTAMAVPASSLTTSNFNSKPLGDWPRLDAMSKPVKERKVAPRRDGAGVSVGLGGSTNDSSTSTFTRPSAPPLPSLNSLTLPPPAPLRLSTSTDASPRRPSGPRMSSERVRSGSMSRPPPLDLSKISNLR